MYHKPAERPAAMLYLFNAAGADKVREGTVGRLG